LQGIKRKLALYLVNHIYAGTDPGRFETKRTLLNSLGHSIGEGTRIAGPVYITGKFVSGRNCWIGANLTIHGNGSVLLGENCDIAPDVMFLTGGHDIGDGSRRAGEGRSYDIHVGSGCWIGARSTITNSISIADGCVVGACSFLNKDTQANGLYCGVPSSRIRDI
jgi:maltose O-acetyltransferase